MAAKSNKIVPLLAFALLAIVGTILFQQFFGSSQPKPGAPLKEVPSAIPKTTKGADADTAEETLKQVAASNKLLRDRIELVIDDNKKLNEQNARLSRSRGSGADPAQGTGGQSPGNQGAVSTRRPPGTTTATTTAATDSPSTTDVFTGAISSATDAVEKLIDASPFQKEKDAARRKDAQDQAATAASIPDGVVRYKLLPPMGYTAQTTKGGPGNPGNASGAPITRFVRTTHVENDSANMGAGTGPAAHAAQQAAAKPQSVPYFTIPENATLAGVTSMSSLIGRVPVDGRVTDPMQFKAIVGRDNLAANGFEMPDDLAGMIVTGIAIGDMALSCSEGKVRSITFVFNDGSIRTVSTRRGRGQVGGGSAGAGSTISGVGQDLGYISDEHGNPCIPGKFVTNAASYLTDIVAAKSLGVAAKAYSEAERTVSTNLVGGYTSSVTGSQNRFALGAAASGAADELSSWLLARLKNSFDAVVTPSGQRLVVHLDQEIQLDKAPNARKLVYRTQGDPQVARGARYGLE